MDLRKLKNPRLLWNLMRFTSGRGTGGFQYSDTFLNLLESQINSALKGSEIVSFNQHFPRVVSVQKWGGRLNHYVDAPFAALSSGRGLDLKLPRDIVSRALDAECLNYEGSDRVITMGRWAADVIRDECGVPSHKVHTILPGANLNLPIGWSFPQFREGAGKTRDFVLGFIGKDWERKGLLWLLDLRNNLQERGWRVVVYAAGNAPASLVGREGLRFAGFIDKGKDPGDFLSFLTTCDLGCLFSKREALGISTLEFLRAGIPVAGYAHEGMADTLPPDAGFRFESGVSIQDAGDELDAYLRNEGLQKRFHSQAQKWSPLMSWERCIQEFQELWTTGSVHRPVQPWRGLDDFPLA